MQQQHPSYHQQSAGPQGYRPAAAEPSGSSLDQQERDSVFKRLGIATDAEFETEQKQSRATLLRDQQAMRGGGAAGGGAVLAPGGPGGAGGYSHSASAASARLYNGGGAAAASTFARAPPSNPNAAYVSGSTNRVQKPDHPQQLYDNPHLVHRNQESYSRSQQQQQQYVGSSLGAGAKPGVAAGGGGPSSGSTSAASRSGGSSSSSEAEGGGHQSDVLRRLGLCSNEEYERQSRAELTDAVRSLRGMKERLGNGLV